MIPYNNYPPPPLKKQMRIHATGTADACPLTASDLYFDHIKVSTGLSIPYNEIEPIVFQKKTCQYCDHEVTTI